MRSFDCLIGWQAHVGEVCSMQFSADETTAYSMGTDGKVSATTLSYSCSSLVHTADSPTLFLIVIPFCGLFFSFLEFSSMVMSFWNFPSPGLGSAPQ